jgi:chaperonin GroES
VKNQSNFCLIQQKNMNIRPISDHIIIEALKADEKTKSGILLPQSSEKDRPEQGTVIAVGIGKTVDGKLIPMEVKVGDKVLFSKYGPHEIKIEDKEYLVASADDILAIID